MKKILLILSLLLSYSSYGSLNFAISHIQNDLFDSKNKKINISTTDEEEHKCQILVYTNSESSKLSISVIDYGYDDIIVGASTIKISSTSPSDSILFHSKGVKLLGKYKQMNIKKDSNKLFVSINSERLDQISCVFNLPENEKRRSFLGFH